MTTAPTAADLRITGNEHPRDMMTAMPGDYAPADYVHVHVWANGQGITVTASYTPVGHGIARTAPHQTMDAAARRVDPTARFSGSDRTAGIYGAFGHGARIRQYAVTPDTRPMPAWIGESLPGPVDPITGPFAR